MTKLRSAMLVGSALLLCGEGSAQEPPNVRSQLQAALGRKVELITVERDSGAVPGLNVWRATGFRCFDCSYVYATLLVRASDSVLVSRIADLPAAWRLVAFAPPQNGADLRGQVLSLLNMTCLPGCRSRVVSRVSDLAEGFRVFLAPADSLGNSDGYPCPCSGGFHHRRQVRRHHGKS